MGLVWGRLCKRRADGNRSRLPAPIHPRNVAGRALPLAGHWRCAGVPSLEPVVGRPDHRRLRAGGEPAVHSRPTIQSGAVSTAVGAAQSVALISILISRFPGLLPGISLVPWIQHWPVRPHTIPPSRTWRGCGVCPRHSRGPRPCGRRAVEGEGRPATGTTAPTSRAGRSRR